LFAARVLRALQPPVGTRHVHHRLHRDRRLVRGLGAEPAADGGDGADAARDGGARRGRAAAVGEVADPRALRYQGDSLPRGVAADAVGAAARAPKLITWNLPLRNRARTGSDVSAA